MINGYFDFFKLHDNEYDKAPRSWIRARGKKLSKTFTRLLPADYVKFLKSEIKRRIGIDVSEQAIKDWANGKYGIPLIALGVVCKTRQDYKKIINSIEYLNTNSSHKVILPKNPSEKLFYFVGVLIGDGSLPFVIRKETSERIWKIAIEMTSINYVKTVLVPLVKDIFNITPRVYKKEKEGRKDSIVMVINSKIVYRFFEKIIEMPVGKKSSRVEIPGYTFLPHNLILSTISGILDTEGGTHMFTFGGSFNSKVLRDQIVEFLKKIGFKIKIWDWINVKGGWSYSLGFKKITHKILKKLKLKNDDVINVIKKGL